MKTGDVFYKQILIANIFIILSLIKNLRHGSLHISSKNIWLKYEISHFLGFLEIQVLSKKWKFS